MFLRIVLLHTLLIYYTVFCILDPDELGISSDSELQRLRKLRSEAKDRYNNLVREHDDHRSLHGPDEKLFKEFKEKVWHECSEISRLEKEIKERERMLENATWSFLEMEQSSLPWSLGYPHCINLYVYNPLIDICYLLSECP